MSKPKLLIFASGTKTGGGSGFEKLVLNEKVGILNAEIIGVVTNHRNGGVAKISDKYGVHKIITSESLDLRKSESNNVLNIYSDIFTVYKPDYVMLSGWIFRIPAPFCGTNILNIHPGPIVDGIDKGKYGKFIHEAIIKAFKEHKIFYTGVTIHIVDKIYDNGKIIFFNRIEILDNDTPETLAARVNEIEHKWQSYVLNCYMHGFDIEIE